MASWASIAKAQAKQPQSGATAVAVAGREGLRLLVVDANAIIDGVRLEGIADEAVTIQEVLDEIRDKQSRQALATLPYELKVAEPSEESVQAVTKFARATGDVAALSATDIKLMALAHALEVAAHGDSHLLKHPNQPRMHNQRGAAETQALPGWGSVPNPEDWRAVDEANEADEAAMAAGSVASRIARQVQQLSLDPCQHDTFLQQQELPPGAAPLTPGAVAAAGAAATPAAGTGTGAGISNSTNAQAGVAASRPAAQQQQQQQQLVQEAADPGAAADASQDDGWEVAAVSKAAARHRRRKAVRKEQHQQAFEAEWEEHAQLVQQQQQQQPQVSTPPRQAVRAGDAAAAADAEAAAADATAATDASGRGQQGAGGSGASTGSQRVQQQQQQQQQQGGTGTGGGSEDEDTDAEEGAAEEATNDELLAAEHCVYTADDDDDDDDGGGAAHHQPQQQPHQGDAASAPTAAVATPQPPPPPPPQQQQQPVPGARGWQSSVATITGDFAMQNVLLQMGLRLLTRDGRRIARLSRYALRCSACFAVTREPGRLFCPKCGNLALDRVEVVVGPDGAEYFGEQKRFILRGTRFSLPKPKGGRGGDDLVLREDVFLQKVRALGRRAVKKKAGNDDAEGAAAAGADPLAPEFSADTWHVPSQQELAQNRGLAAVLQPAWKHNPNERKLTRSNRRG